MKNYRQLVKELPSKSIVISFDSFSPPTAQHELGFKLVEKLVKLNNADHAVYIKEASGSLPTDRQQHFLDIMFNGVNFMPLKGTLEEEVAALKKRYKNVIVVTSEESKKAITKNLMESVQVVVSEDLNEIKMKSIISKGDYTSFKKNMPSSFRDIDAKRLFNEMRQTFGLESIKDEVKFSIDTLRDKYFKGEIYHIGDIVESAGQEYEIMDRGANYLVVVNNTGDLSRKWVKDVNLVEAKNDLSKACWKGYKAVGLKNKNGKQVPNCVPESVLNPMDPHGDYQAKKKVLLDLGKNKDVDQGHVQQRTLDLDKEYTKYKLKEAVDPSQFCYKGYTTKNFHHCSDSATTFTLSSKEVTDPVAMLKAVKTTDTYLELHGQYGDNPTLDQLKTWKAAHIQAKDTLMHLGKFDAHQEVWAKHGKALDHMLKPHAQKIKEELNIGKHSNENIGRSARSYQDVMKMFKKDRGVMPSTKEVSVPIEPNISQQIDDLEPQWPRHPQTAPGHTLATDPHLRRRKVMYATESLQGDLMDEDFAAKFTESWSDTGKTGKHDASGEDSKEQHKVDKDGKPTGERRWMTKSGKAIAEGEVGPDTVIKKVKTLPPELAPNKKDSDRVGGGTRDHTFSAFIEKQKKENVDFDFDQLVKRRLARE